MDRPFLTGDKVRFKNWMGFGEWLGIKDGTPGVVVCDTFPGTVKFEGIEEPVAVWANVLEHAEENDAPATVESA